MTLIAKRTDNSLYWQRFANTKIFIYLKRLTSNVTAANYRRQREERGRSTATAGLDGNPLAAAPDRIGRIAAALVATCLRRLLPVLASRPQPSLTLPALRQAVAAVAPARLPEMFTKMQEAFDRAGEEGSVTPIHMFYREWAVIVEIERHPDVASRLHRAEQALMSGDAQVRDAAVRDAGDIVRAAHRTVTGE